MGAFGRRCEVLSELFYGGFWGYMYLDWSDALVINKKIGMWLVESRGKAILASGLGS